LPGARVDPFVNLDALTYWVPLLREAATQWRAGVAPLWNPYQGLGGPLLATAQVGAAYPLNAAYLWLEPGAAWVATGVLHHAISAVGTYALCRAVGLARSAALVGAAVYAFSGLVLGKYIDQPQFLCLAWVPAMFACAERLLLVPSAGRATALGVVWALEILGGSPQTLTQSSLLLAAFIGTRVLTECRSAGCTTARITASLFAAAAALALTAFQWLPTLELTGLSVRAMGSLTSAQQGVLAADPSRLAAGTVGPLPLAMIGFWMWRRRDLAWFFGATAALLFLLALGPATPLHDLFRLFPTGTWFRAPVRLLNLWPLCIALLAAAGGAELQHGRATRDWRHRVAVAASALVATTALRIAVRGARPLDRVGLVILAYDVLPLAAWVLVDLVFRRRATAFPRARRLAPAIAVAIACAAPGFALDRFVSPLQVAELYRPHRDLFASLGQHAPARALSLLRFGNHGDWAKLGTYFEVPVVNDLEPLSLRDFRTYSIALRGLPTEPAGSPSTVFMGEVFPPLDRYDSRLMKLAGVRFVVADPDTALSVETRCADDLHQVAQVRSSRHVVFENQAAAERAFFVRATGAVVEADAARCLRILRSPEFDPATMLLLDRPGPDTPNDLAHGVASIQFGAYGPDVVRIDVVADIPGFVVLTDAFYPGWTVDVDGAAAAAPLRADCFFRAVPVPAGAHSIVFRYAPASFRAGVVTSAATLVGLALIRVAAARRRGSAGPEE
jgi:hypothetical protein